MSDSEDFVFDDDSGCEMDIDETIPVSSAILNKDPYEIQDNQSLREVLKAEVTDLCDLLSVTFDEAICLLRAFKFDSQKVQEQWFDNESKARRTAGIVDEKPMQHPTGGPVACVSCMETLPASSILQLGCAHAQCVDCWAGYVRSSVSHGREALLLSCPGCDIVNGKPRKCVNKVPFSFVLKTLESDTELLQRYEGLFFDSFVDEMPDLRRCPNAGCEFSARRVLSLTSKDVECRCGFLFCFQCGNESHRPADCKVARDWEAKNKDSSQNVTWLLANTKPCPKCKKAIEKNQGCNHMTCSCGFHFCWICLRDWTTHGSDTGGYYNCNVYKKTEADDKINDLRRTMDMYMHYFERYMNHNKAKTFVDRDLNELSAKVEALYTKYGWDMGSLDFLSDALRLVKECRHVLKWTYAMGYFLPDGKEKALFDFLQKNLEEHTEKLHSLYEKDGNRFLKAPQDLNRRVLANQPQIDKFEAFKATMINYSNATSSFMTRLVEDIEDGHITEGNEISPKRSKFA